MRVAALALVTLVACSDAAGIKGMSEEIMLRSASLAATRIAKANEQREQAAMEALGVTAITPAQLSWREQRWQGQEREQTHPAGEVFEQNGQRYIAGHPWWTFEGSMTPFELVIDRHGDLHELVREPRVIGTHVTKQPGCEPTSWGSPCPGCADTMQLVYGPLPSGMAFKGRIVLRYDTITLSTAWADGRCPLTGPAPP